MATPKILTEEELKDRIGQLELCGCAICRQKLEALFSLRASRQEVEMLKKELETMKEAWRKRHINSASIMAGKYIELARNADALASKEEGK